jgi:DNA polymerase III subunit delta'
MGVLTLRHHGWVAALYSSVVGQEAAVSQMRVAATRPVHAYLLVGPPGTGKAAAAVSFAAALLCPAGGDGTCESCRRVVGGTHPDVTVVAREGAAITIDSAREIARLALRSPVEGERKVLVLEDFHLVKEAGPALLKTIEEPPPTVVFVILAEFVPPELVTIASRCVQIEFRALTSDEVVGALVAEGVDDDRAQQLAVVAGGRLDRARLLAGDPEFERRRQAWAAVPSRLDGHGATAAAVVDELVGLLESSIGPLRQRHEAEVGAIEERNARAVAVNGKVGRRATSKTGIKELEDRHKRELRRQRTDELRAGLACLAGTYRDRALAGGRGMTGALAAVDMIQHTAANLEFNPGEVLSLQALVVRLGRLEVQTN